MQLVEIIDLKWMLAGEGVHVHVEKLQSDHAYAQQCLHLADRSRNPTLRLVAASLRARMEWDASD